MTASPPDSSARPGWTDEQVEHLVARLLQIGVLLAALVVAAGAIVYLVNDGGTQADHRHFHGEPGALRSPADIIVGSVDWHGRGLIQLGLLLLILTPVARVVFSVFAFLVQRDYLFVGITLVVLAILLFSLLGAPLLLG